MEEMNAENYALKNLIIDLMYAIQAVSLEGSSELIQRAREAVEI